MSPLVTSLWVQSSNRTEWDSLCEPRSSDPLGQFPRYEDSPRSLSDEGLKAGGGSEPRAERSRALGCKESRGSPGGGQEGLGHAATSGRPQASQFNRNLALPPTTWVTMSK